MKELSIEEKARRYDEAIDKFDAILNLDIVKESGTIFADDVRKIFPELKESEDEKIRKALISVLKSDFEKDTTIHGITVNDILAWLEKQGEQPKKHDVCDNCDQQGSCVSPCPMKLVEKQNEQEQSDKVEPKFHKGEWLCENEPNNYARFIQILETVNVQGKERYRISIDIHNDEDIVEFDFVEKYYHKFDIKDAKDGDVLHCWIDGYEFVLIYKGIKDGYITTYGHLYQNLKSFSEEPTTMFCRTIQGHFTPATKEQRDILMKAMADAGYTFDFEKKELKKIEQKLADKINQEWIPQTGDTFRKKGTTSPTYHLCNKREDGITFDFVENREVGIAGGEITIFALRQDYELVERPKSAEDVVEEELNRALQTKVEQNPAWSEEDETIKNNISHIIRQYDKISKRENKPCWYIGDCLLWMQNIKDRVQPQPKQEWSYGDEAHLHSLITHLEQWIESNPDTTGADIQGENVAWLKSLRPQK